MKIKCNCANSFQDYLYGPGIRVANPVNKTAVNGKVVDYRCTVCGKVQNNTQGRELNRKTVV